MYIKLYRREAMEAISYTAARQNLSKTMEKVCKDHTPVIVTRQKSDSVVIMSLSDYEALEETAYLLRSPRNARRLIESMASSKRVRAPKGISLSESRLLRPRMGGLPLLAKDRPECAQENQPTHQREHEGSVRGLREA
jgi:antitoxin YefM